MRPGKNLFEMWTWMASFGFLAMLQQFIPREYTDSVRRNLRIWLQRMTPYIFCDIPEYQNSVRNSLYGHVEAYINSLRVQGAQRLNLFKSKNAKALIFALAHDQRTVDTFDNAKVEWVHQISPATRSPYSGYFGIDTQGDERRKYILQIGKRDKERVLDAYMAHIETRALELKQAERDLLLYTNTKGSSYYLRRTSGPWQSVPFLHPANFSTLALDGDLKSRLVADLERFAANEDYYKRVGKAWKRGYLLYGPPGTGKSSMIAAVANKMRYDVYDLELTEVTSNTELRQLLLSTSNKSVIVIEDIDCSLDLSGQRKTKKKEEKPAVPAGTPPVPGARPPPKDEQSKVTLSGLLNFVDGLWSCCGSERIFIFTTNYVEKIDPALLRAGRMDMHVHLGYCTFSAFKMLANNYLQITEHELFEKLETAFVGSFMTPAAVSEVLISSQDVDVDVSLERLIVELGEHRVDPSIPKKKEKKKREKDGASAAAKPQDEKEAAEVTDESSCSDEEEEKQPIPATLSAHDKKTEQQEAAIKPDPEMENVAKEPSSAVKSESEAQKDSDTVKNPDATSESPVCTCKAKQDIQLWHNLEADLQAPRKNS